MLGAVGTEQQPVGPVARRHPDVVPPRDDAEHRAVVGCGGAQADPGLEVGRVGQPGRDDEAFAEELVEARRRDGDGETGAGLERPAAGHPAPGPGHEVVREKRLHDRPPSALLRAWPGARSGPWWERSGGRSPATPPSARSRLRPRPPGTRTAPRRHPGPRRCARRGRTMSPQHADATHRTGHHAHAARRRGLAQRVGHAAAVDAGRARIVERPVHRAQGREQRDGVFGGDLAHAPLGAVDARARRRARTRAPRSRAARRRGDRTWHSPTDRCRRHRGGGGRATRVMVAGTMGQLPPEGLGGRMRVGRQNARAGIGGPSRMAGVDQGDLCPPADQFVGQRKADEPSPGDGHVTRLCAHDPAGYGEQPPCASLSVCRSAPLRWPSCASSPGCPA